MMSEPGLNLRSGIIGRFEEHSIFYKWYLNKKCDPVCGPWSDQAAELKMFASLVPHVVTKLTSLRFKITKLGFT